MSSRHLSSKHTISVAEPSMTYKSEINEGKTQKKSMYFGLAILENHLGLSRLIGEKVT